MTSPGALEEFCGSSLWDWKLTWNTTDPDFTDCFHKTVLIWIPCAFLWVFAPLETYYLLKSTCKDIPWTSLNLCKIAIASLLSILVLVEMSYSVHQHVSLGYNVPSVQYYAPFIKLVTFLLVIAFVVAGRIKGIQSSGVLFLFWLLLTVTGAFTYASHIRRALNETSIEDTFEFTINMLYYPLVVSEFILSWLADSRPKYRENFSADDEKENPERSASFPSRLLFWWFKDLAILGWKRPLERNDLWNLNYEDQLTNILPRFDQHWRKEMVKRRRSSARSVSFSAQRTDDVTIIDDRKKKPPTVLIPLVKAFGPLFFFGSLFKLGHDILQFVGPQVLKLLIGFTSSDEPLWKGIFFAFLLFLAASLQSLMLGFYFHRMFLVGMRVRASLMAAIYRKALVLSNAARRESTVGEIVNLMSVDAQRFLDLIPFLNLVWSAPFQIVLALYFLWQELGPAVLAGLFVMLLMIPVNGVIANYTKKLQVLQMKMKDERVKLMNEILSGMKVLKLYAWEKSFEDKILAIRQNEVKTLRKMAYLGAVGAFLWTCTPFLVALASFATYVLSDENNVLNARRAFVSLTLFHILRFPLSMLPMLITMLVQTIVSLKRINKYMGSEELDPYVSRDPVESANIVVDNGTFTWTRSENPVLKNITIAVPKGSLTAVVGQVGAGKSSLLAAILGDMEKIEGRVCVKGSVAYVAQQAWIQNATLRDNILFSSPYEEERYQKIVEACALKSDLDILPGGDMTEIGEKGINLSGGQKQRVSLARAAYSDADNYLLDDPLSAVDSHVGKHIFENVIGPNGILKGKTRILVTHGLSFLPQVDNIVVLKDGTIQEMGSYKELLDKKGAFAEFLVQYLVEEGEAEVENLAGEELDLVEEIIHKVGSPDMDRQLSRRLSSTDSTSEERRQILRSFSRTMSQSSSDSNRNFNNSIHRSNSSLSRSTSHLRDGKSKDSPVKDGGIKKSMATGTKLVEVEKTETGEVKLAVYMQYMQSIGYMWLLAIVLGFVGFQSFSISSNIWLSYWSNDQPNEEGQQDHAKRDLRLGVYGALGGGQGLCVFLATFALSFGTMKASTLLHSEMLQNIMRSPTSFFDTTPLGRIINRFSKDIDTVDVIIPNNIRGWLLCALQVLATFCVIAFQTVEFLAVIVPLGFVYYFIQKFYVSTSRQLKRLESVTRSPIYSQFSETLTGVTTIRAYGVQGRFVEHSNQQMDLNNTCYYPSIIANRWLAIWLEFCGNCVVLFAALFAVIGRDSLSPGIVGLSVSYALSVTATLNWMVRMASELETNIVSVERIMEYCNTPTEARWDIPEHKPDDDWPDHGEVILDNYSTRYREGLELVLKNITCRVNPGEKVGIVGRTGAGKSSLTLGLFRLIEAVDGQILIDGVNISQIGLHDLRSKITIIPQDPVLFSGSLRMNLDPFDKHSDEEVWKALELAHLKSFVTGLEAGLQHEVSEGGENLSVGQRQLVCLARALLRKTKVLVLDEATAAVDLETDDLIQTTIRKEFTGCTVLTIAHRLNTILDYDRVMVLDKGRIIEFDSPNELIKNPKTVFHGLAKDAGLV